MRCLVSYMSLILAWILICPAPAEADDVLDGWMRRGSVYQRIEMDEGTSRACSALCNADEMCMSWVWSQANLDGPYPMCRLLSSAPTPHRSPGRITGLAENIALRIEAAAERTPSEREIPALRAAQD